MGMVLFQRLESVGLKERIEASLRQAILDGALSPGQKLVEGEIARQFGVSRSPVREAIQELERQGYVVKSPRRGTYVTELTAEDVTEVYTLRLVLEGYAAGVAGRACEPMVLDRMQGLVERMKQAASKPSYEDFSEADLEFHNLLCSAAGHSRLVYLSKCLRTQMGFLAVLPKYSATELSTLVEDHRSLVEAIFDRRPDRARQIIQSHIRRAGTLFIEKYFAAEALVVSERMERYWAACE